MNSNLQEAYQVLKQRSEERDRHLSALLDISRSVATARDPKPLLGLILDELKGVVPYTSAAVLTLDADGFRIRQGRGPLPWDRVLLDDFPTTSQIYQRVVVDRQPTIIPDVTAGTPLARAYWDAVGDASDALNQNLRAWMGIPLITRERVIGMLAFDHNQPGYYTAQHAESALSFAHIAAIALQNADSLAVEQRRAEQFRIISEVGRYITSIVDLDQLLNAVVQSIQSTFDYYHVGIGLVEGDELVYRAGAGELWNDASFEFEPARLKVGQQGMGGWVVASGQPLLATDVSKEPHYVHMAGSQTKSELTLPIKAHGAVIGVLDVQDDHLNAFDDVDLMVLQSLADQVGVAIQNATLFAAAQRRSDYFRAIYEVGQRITTILEVDELLSHTVRLIRDTFGYYHIHIGLVEGEDLVFPPSAGIMHDEHCIQCEGVRMRIGQDGITGRAAASGEPILVPDISRDARFVTAHTETRGSAFAVPLKLKDRVLGVLEVESEAVNAFDDSDVHVLQALANQIAVALENARLYEQAQSLAVLEERQRLARELHDSVSQALYGIALSTNTALTIVQRAESGEVPAANLTHPLEYTLSLAQTGMAEMRALLFELRPESLEKEGLVAALKKQAAVVKARHRLVIEARLEDEPAIPLPVKEALYRISQEALNNVVKHAAASRVEIKLEAQGDSLLLQIGDDGRGFDPGASFPGHLGLHSMRERVQALGGSLQISSSPGEGTVVEARVPH